MSSVNLETDLIKLKGIGDARARVLSDVGLNKVAELIDYWPRRYVDFSNVSNISELTPGNVTLKVKLLRIDGRWGKNRSIHISEGVFADSTGKIKIVFFNQPFRLNYFKSNLEYFLSGEFKFSGGGLGIANPIVEVAGGGAGINTARILPIYPERKGLGSGLMRQLIAQLKPVFEDLSETLPSEIINGNKLIGYSEALWQLHSPDSTIELQQARRRLAFEELFILQLALLGNKTSSKGLKAPEIKFDLGVVKGILERLNFSLTDDQRASAWQILQDLEKSEPMNRMLLGDVGSGKTIVAALAGAGAAIAGVQVAILAPTEVLARQHFTTFSKLLEPLLCDNIKVGLLVGSLKKAEKQKILSEVKSGKVNFIIGTHAIIQDTVEFNHLGLVVVDEQHRFGVEQRKALSKKVGAGKFPHVLTMSATPIPRSLALVLYGEMQRSVIKSKPAERLVIETKLVPGASKKMIWDKVGLELEAGNAVIFVCPAISEAEAETIDTGRVAAEKIYKELAKKSIARKFGLGLLHGKLKSEQKDNIMEEFMSGDINILVSTTVIEVGVDVPRATVMVIEGAEFFGLAQLHQLRGRVGRSNKQSYCYLVPTGTNIPDRLRYFERNDNGFKLAEYDLAQRGPGQIYGKMQSGALDLRMIDTGDINDMSLVELSRSEAKRVVAKKIELSATIKDKIAKHQGLEILN